MSLFPFRFLLPLLFALSILPAMAAGQGAPAVQPAVADPAACPKPVWPGEALRKRQSGTVTLALAIGADGKVTQSRVWATSFFPLLDAAASKAFSQCRFQPAMEKGVAVASTLRMDYIWHLDGAAEPFADAPADLRPFLVQARRADAIVDPYERCMAFPDFPGNAWPAGLTKQYCNLAAGPRVCCKALLQLIDSGQVEQLDTLLRRDLARHFADGDFSEVIHADFAFFMNASEEVNRVSQKWLDQAPNSAFANTARAQYLLAAASAARGDKWARDTPDDNMARMTILLRESDTLFEKALRREPRLMHAYVGQINIGRMQSGKTTGKRAYERGVAVDPGCRALQLARLDALLPRWGGSYQKMQALNDKLKPLIAQRPMLALNLGLPDLDKAWFLREDKKFAEAVQVLTPAAKLAPYEYLFARLGLDMRFSGADSWQTLVVLLVAYRYGNTDAQSTAERARLLLDVAHDPAWALASSKQAVAFDASALWTRYDLGRVHLALSEFDQAEASLTASLPASETKEDALYQLFVVADRQGKTDQLAKRAEDLIASYPQQPRGYFLRGYAKMRKGDEAGAVVAFREFDRLAKSRGDFMTFWPQIVQARKYVMGIRSPTLVPSMQAVF